MKRNYNIFGHYTWCVPGVGGMFMLLLWLLVGGLLGSIIIAPFSFFMSPQDATQYGMMVSYPIQFIPAMIWAASKSRGNCMTQEGIKLDNGHFGATGGVVCAVLVSLATLAGGFCVEPLGRLLPDMPDMLKQVLENLTQGDLWANILCVGVFAPFFEEWLCRGMVLRGLLGRNVKPTVAIAVSALFFALIHGNPWQAIPAFAMGCLMGYVYYKTGSLKLTMLMHCVNNTFAAVLGHVDSLKEMESWMDVIPVRLYWVIFTGCLLLLVLIVNVLARIPLENRQGNQDRVPSMFEQ